MEHGLIVPKLPAMLHSRDLKTPRFRERICILVCNLRREFWDSCAEKRGIFSDGAVIMMEFGAQFERDRKAMAFKEKCPTRAAGSP
jgi:hypothetical protein